MSLARRRLGWTVAWVLCALAWPLVAQQDRGAEIIRIEASAKRWALVIGNADYENGRLKNPLNDARALKDELAELGFDVTLLENADRRAMEDAIRTFAFRLRQGGVGVFFFAGHGVQLEGLNYLLPTGAEVQSAADIRYKTVPLGFLLDHLGEADNQLNIVILDACRDNPFRGFSRNLNRGLAEATAPTGTLIAYATAPGQVAADGAGANSPFTEHLLASLAEEGLEIEEVMKRTRVAVKEASGNQQVPWTASSLTGSFVPRPKKPPQEVRVTVPEPPRGGDFSLDDLRRWNTRLQDMKKAFADTNTFDGEAGPATLKVAAWQRFLDSFGEDNPFSQEDDELRQQATTRRDHLSPKGEMPTSVASSSGRRINLKAGDVVDELPDIGMIFRLVPSGKFRIGSPNDEKDRGKDEVLHTVKLTRNVAMSETEITQAQWEKLMRSNPSRFTGFDDCPVEMVNWFEALAFANALSRHANIGECYLLSVDNGKKPGENLVYKNVELKSLDCPGYRLPTEAEWEYAARAGTSTPFWTGENLTAEQANFNGNHPYAGNYEGEYREKTISVRSFKPNPWNLHDMHGNVWEWTQDFADYKGGVVTQTYKDRVENPLGLQGPLRVIRGGSWYSSARSCRAALRSAFAPDARFDYVGFRVVRTLP